MIRAYNEILLDKATDSLGRMLDFSVHSLHISVDSIMHLFMASGAASLFERGDIKLICGMSGIELSYEILERSGMAYERTNPRHTVALSPEYWCGYMLSYLQWSHSAAFSEIIELVKPEELIGEYKECRSKALADLPWDADDAGRQAALALAAETFLDLVPALYEARKTAMNQASLSSDSPLKKMRIKNGLSQSELAKASGVPVRTIQQYEQRRKEINHARAEYLIMLSSALNCSPELLLNR